MYIASGTPARARVAPRTRRAARGLHRPGHV